MSMDTQQISDLAREIRIQILHTIKGAGMGHIGGDFSVTDILATLFGSVLNVDPKDPNKSDRDRIILSKGHAAVALYSTLASCGFFPVEDLKTFAKPLSNLNGHPNRNKVPGVESNTGPLGHGFPIAVGTAIGAQLAKNGSRSFVIMGDGELQEGSNWEAAMFAGHRKLTNLIAVIDRNGFQQGSPTSKTNELDPLDKKFESFGWEVRVVDGHDYVALHKALIDPQTKPRVVIAQTTKGKGVDFMEGKAEWHHKVPTTEQYEAALMQLGKQ
ncbi:MAG: transketolase [Candidatus Planktophila sp.]|nr:transketolase [Candidatus Planktophila sp.]